MTSNKNGRGVSGLIRKLEHCIVEENYYEAHQLYRTLYFRYLSQHKYVELIDRLHSGALILLYNDQKASGADVSILLIDVLTKSDIIPSEDWFTKLTNLFKLIGPFTPERETFLVNLLTWSKEKDSKTLGHPTLHQFIAQAYWNEKNYVQAKYHFMFSRDGKGCASMLIELHTLKGLGTEVDLFIAQAVLQYLCRQNKETAEETFTVYTKTHPSIKKKGPPYIFPLLNFLWFLLKAIESPQLTTFTILCDQYQLSLKRDPSYVQYLDKIGQLFFGIPPPRPRNMGGGLIGNFMQSLFTGLENESSDEDRPGTSSIAAELD